MQTKANLPLSAFTGRDLPPLIAAYFEMDHLKQLYRQGWLRRGVPPERCESVAEHVFAMALLGWWIADAYFPHLDRDKILRLTLAHELGEIYTGDIIPADGVPPEEKQRQERAGVETITARLPNGAEYLALWEEYDAAQTPEARFVKQIDRLEMACQAAVYHSQGFPAMAEFFESASQSIHDPQLREILDALDALRA